MANGRLPGTEIISTGGTVTYSGTLRFGSTYSYTSGTVDTTTSTVLLQASTSIVPGTFAYNNVTFNGNNSTFTLNGTMTVNGTLSLADLNGASGNINTGTIEAKGNISVTNYGYSGTGLVKVNGSTTQTITGAATAAYFPFFEIASSGGVVNLVGTLSFPKNYTYTSGTVNAGTSTLQFVTTSTITPGSPDYYNVTFSNPSSGTIFTLNGTLNVNGTLALYTGGSTGSAINSGTIVSRGNISVTGYGAYGTSLLRIAGSGNQTITGVSTGKFPPIEIASTGGIVSYSGFINPIGNYTYTSGTVDAGTSTVTFQVSSTLTPGSIAHHNVTFNGTVSTYTLVGNLDVNGNLAIADASSSSGNINGGTISVSGNLSFSNYGCQGSTQLIIDGSTSSTVSVTALARRPIGQVTLNKTGAGSLTLLSNTLFNGAGQSMNISGGSINMSGFNLTVTSTLTLAGGTFITKGGGTLTANGSAVPAGAYSGGTINP